MLAVVVGLARMINGDALLTGNEQIQLHGIDGPELHKTCQTATAR